MSLRANRLKIEDIIAFLNKERHEALDVRDPIAIALAAERYNTLSEVLKEHDATEVMDLYKPILSVSQAAKLLGYNAKEVRRLLGQGKISGKKVNNQWRIPLKAVL
jgi:excisionase family DNA binding protein